MASNRGVAYLEPGKVEVQSIDYPHLALGDRPCQHGVILRVLTTNICGSDQHMVRGRTTAPPGLILGHEITGEIIECGRDVEFLRVGDIVVATGLRQPNVSNHLSRMRASGVVKSSKVGREVFRAQSPRS